MLLTLMVIMFTLGNVGEGWEGEEEGDVLSEGYKCGPAPLIIIIAVVIIIIIITSMILAIIASSSP